MSVSSTDNQVIYTGSGTTGPFDFDFKIYATSELLIEKYTIATGVSTPLTETTDYVVTIDGEDGGEVNLVAVLSSAYKLVITRQLPLTQEVTYVENDKFPAATHEEALDRSRMIDQQLQEQLDRCVKVVAGSSTDPDDLVDELVQAAADAETAKIAAEVAQGLAEDAKDAAVIAQGLAEDAADEAIGYFPSIAGNADKVLAVKSDATGTEWIVPSGGSSAVELSFVNADLSTGVLTVTHNGGLSAGYTAIVQIVNNSGAVVIPDQINTFAANSFKVDLTSYGVLTGTWFCTYIVKG